MRRARVLASLLTVLLTSAGVVFSQAMQDADRCAQESNPDVGIPFCTRAIESRQLSNELLAKTFYNRGTAHRAQGDNDRAVADYTEAIRLAPNEYRAFTNRANAYRDKGDYARAIRDYDAAIRLRPNDAQMFFNRGGAYGETQDWDHAIEDLNEAIRLRPNYADAFNMRGLAYRGTGDHDRAIADYTEAIRLDPGHANARNNRGNAYCAKGECDRAIPDYDEAIQLNPTHAPAFNNRGVAYRARGEHDRAIASYNQAIRLDPNYAIAYQNRGLARFDRGEFAAAIPDFAKTVALAPNDRYNHVRLYLATQRAGQGGGGNLADFAARRDLKGWPGPVVALYLGRLTPARVLESAVALDPRRKRELQCEAHYYVGEYLVTQGAKDEAIGMFRTALAVCPPTFFEYGSAAAALKRLGE